MMKALIVEDHRATRTLLEFHVQSLGYDVTGCQDAETALLAYHQTCYQLILLDLGLPGINGLEFCRRIQVLPGRNRNIVLVITGSDTMEDLQAALGAGADDYLIKPVSQKLLSIRITIIQQQLQNRILRKQAEEALREREETVRALLNSPADAIVLIDPRGTVLEMNKTFASRLRISFEKIIGISLWELFSSEMAEQTCRQVRTVIQTGEFARFESRWQENWCDIVIYPIPDVRGRVERLALIARSIDEWKHKEEKGVKCRQQLEELLEARRAELLEKETQIRQISSEDEQIKQALHASEKQYRRLAQKVNDGILILQEETVVFVNEALTSMLGLSGERDRRKHQDQLWLDDFRVQIAPQISLIEKGDMREPCWQMSCLSLDARKLRLEMTWDEIRWKEKSAILLMLNELDGNEPRRVEAERSGSGEKIELQTPGEIRERFGAIIGKSLAMQTVYELIVQAAASDFNVIVSGESGTGKELVARTIHERSTRKEKAFVPVNCGAIPENLFESEFFGYKKGAFTGAHKDRKGYFDLAHQGTLFLDEISELKHDMQVKLLRALEDGEYIPVGDNTCQNADVRVIAASNRNLEELVKHGVMREDFFYRIKVLSICVPPLRKRKEDIPLLIESFFNQYEGDPHKPTLPSRVMRRLELYDWPGNVRELQNVLQRYLVTKELDFSTFSQESPPIQSERRSLFSNSSTLREAQEAFEKNFLLTMLEQHHWHREKTAQALGIPSRTLHRKMKKYQIK